MTNLINFVPSIQAFFFLIFFSFIICNDLSAQIEPISVQASGSVTMNPYDSLENGILMSITIDFNDSQDLGELITHIYNSENGDLVAKFAGTRNELITQEVLIDDTIEAEIYLPESPGGYRIETLVITSQGAHKPVIITNYTL